MARLSISTAWTETGQFLAREAGLVLPIAFLFIALPPAANVLLLPLSDGPEPVGRIFLDLGLTLLAVVTGLIGSIAIGHLALVPGVSVREALHRGLTRFLSLLGMSLLVIIPLIILMVILVMIALPNAGSIPNPQAPGPLFSILVIVAFVAIWTKFSMATPVTAQEQEGPVGILTRSWELTAGHYPKLFATFLALTFVSWLAVLGLSSGLGVLIVLAAGPPAVGSLSFIAIVMLDTILQTIVIAVTGVLIARLYVQLAQDESYAQLARDETETA